MNVRLARFLAEKDVPYEKISHRPAASSEEVANSLHLPARRLAKTLLVRDGDGRFSVVVLPASCRVDLIALGFASRTRKHVLATEDEVERQFPDCESGAMPPFGNLYGLPVFVDACVPRTEEFAFQAGSRRQVVVMKYRDFERLVRPIVSEFCLHERDAVPG